MEISRSKTPIKIISKLNQKVQNTNNAEFNLKQVLENYIIDDIKYKHEYEYMLSIIKQSQSEQEFVNLLLDQLKQSVDILEPKYFENKLINLIFFEIKWHVYYSKNSDILNKLSEFLIDLNSAYTNYIKKCLAFLIKMFTIVNHSGQNQEQASSVNVQETFDCENLYKFSHNIIINLIKVAPSSRTTLLKLLDSCFPYMIKDTSIQDAYISNLLKVAHNFKDLRLMLLEVCVQKMLKIDVNSVAYQILEAERIDDTSEESKGEERDETNKYFQSMKHPLADRLDVMMYNLFKFIESNCKTSEINNQNLKSINWDSCKSIYKDLLFVFDKYIISTYGSSHVQFLMFYVCSYNPMLSEGFLDYLWKKFSSISSNGITRQICAYYIGSMLSRAKFIPINSCLATLQLIVTWIHNYINKASLNISSGNGTSLDSHRTFYSLCQTLFYVIIFRNKQLFQEGKHKDLVKSWKLNEIVSCKLNPLRYCLKTISKKFARITCINQIAYCYSIIDANNRLTIPISGQSTKSVRMFFSNQNDASFLSKNESKSHMTNSSIQENPLDSFFPFDPYLLKRSKIFVEKFYQEFQNVDDDLGSDDSDEDEDEDDDDNEDEEEDDDNDEEENKNDSEKEKEEDSEGDNDEEVQDRGGNRIFDEILSDQDDDEADFRLKIASFNKRFKNMNNENNKFQYFDSVDS